MTAGIVTGRSCGSGVLTTPQFRQTGFGGAKRLPHERRKGRANDGSGADGVTKSRWEESQ